MGKFTLTAVLYITECIYQGRSKCSEMINFAKLYLKTAEINTLLVKLLIIHNKEIIRIGLGNESSSLINSIYKFLNDKAKIGLFKLHIKYCLCYDVSVSPDFTREIMRSLKSSIVFWQLVQLFEPLGKVYEQIKNIISKLNFTNTQKELWQKLDRIITYKEISPALTEFYELTGINRQKHHLRLSLDLRKSSTLSANLIHKIAILKQDIIRIGPSKSLIKLNEVINNANLLADLLENPALINEINSEHTMRAIEFLDKIHKALSFKITENEYFSVCRKRNEGHEVPLICIERNCYDYLEDMLKDNNKHDENHLSYVSTQHEIEIILKSKFNLKYNIGYLENAQKSSKYSYLQKLMKSFGGDFNFSINNNHFITKINLRIVDYVKI